MESSIRTGALRIDFSSSSGEEGVLTISGVRLENWGGGEESQTELLASFPWECLTCIVNTNEQ